MISWIINGLALAAAAFLVPGVTIVGEPAWVTVAAMAIVFGLANALIRPLVKLLTCPLIILTLGLFTLVINALMLWLSSWIAAQFGVGFEVDGLWPAFLGALVISVVSFFLNLILLGDENRRRKRKKEPRDRW